MEERGCASDTELDDSKPTICWQADIAVAHPKPVSQFKRLAFLDLEDDLFLDRSDINRLTPPSDDTSPSLRPLSRPQANDREPAVESSLFDRESCFLEVSKYAIDHNEKHAGDSLEAAAATAAAAAVAERVPTVQAPLPSSSINDSSESVSVTSMSCDYDTAPSEDEGRLGSRAERKRILLERLMRYFHSIFAACPPQTRTHGSGSGSVSSGSGRSGDTGTVQSEQLNDYNVETRRLLDNRKRRPEDEDGDDEGDGSNRKRPRQHDDDKEAPLRLACPFFKKNPRRYRLSRSCPGPGWSTVHRVKYIYLP